MFATHANHPLPQMAVCTIASKNYLAFVRTLMRSVAAAHPTWKRYLLLVDDLEGYFDPDAEPFEVVPLSEIPLPDTKQLLFRYTLLELNTAVKPWLLQWLFEHRSAERVVYLDPDIRVYAPLTEVEHALDGGALMTLTPHLLAELTDTRRPNEQDVLRAGCYNLGFLALARHRELPCFLRWWQNKLTYDCRVDQAHGLFVDQKWMDLAPGLFSDVAILRHPGYNVAYWNLAQRPIRIDTAGATIGSDPLVFFHFSGLDPLAPEAFSKHQDRYRLEDLGPCATLVQAYCREVLDNGWQTCKSWPYAFGVLGDGTPIPAALRHYYRARPEIIRLVGSDPFQHRHAYLNESVDGGRQPLITQIMRVIWESRQDLRDAFPDILGSWREAFIHHFVDVGAGQEGIPEAFVQPVRASLSAWRESQRPPKPPAPALQIFEPPCEVEEDHPATWPIRGIARALLTVAPVLPAPQRLRPYYRLVRPLRLLLPAGARRQLKRELVPRLHQKRAGQGAGQGAGALIRLFRSLARWLRHWLRLGGPEPTKAASAAPGIAASGEGSGTGRHLRLWAQGKLSVVENGLNIVGYFQAGTGVGESARLCVQAASAAGLLYSVHDITPDTTRTAPEVGWAAPPAGYAVNLLHVNADQMAFVREALGARFFAGRYNIGLWHWELPTFPDRWRAAFDHVDEIWAPSRFIQDALALRSPRPVVRIPHAIRFTPNRHAARRDFGLPSDQLLFLMMYDVRSFPARKNPEGAIEAFRRAFGGARDVSLVIKVHDSLGRTDGAKRLGPLLRGLANVHVLEERMDRQRTYDLLALCDCTVSLHRAEGFGLVLAESMFLGKPVIATGWSGNMEFMTAQSSCPVDYRLVRLKHDVGPYKRGQVWAEPDLEHAAELMKKVAGEPSWARRIADAGQAAILGHFSPERIGALYRERLNAILGWHPAQSRAGRAAA